MEQMYDVFLSYSSKDKDVAFYICDKIEEQGLKCWIAPRNEVGGMTYARQILKAISNSVVVVVCFSRHANVSDHVESEIDNAFSAGKVIIPFRIDDCEMSAEMKYYLNKKHWQNGIPVNEESVNSLINSIIANIPERAKDKDFESSIEKIIEETENIVVSTDDTETALGLADDTATMERLKKLKMIYEHVLTIENKIEFAKLVKSFIDEMPDGSGLSGDHYDLLENPKGELMLIVRKMNGSVDNARFVIDSSATGLLYKNSESAKIMELNEKALEAFKKVGQLLVVEIENDNVAEEYMVPVRFINDFNSVGSDNGLSEEEIQVDETNRIDWLSDEKGKLFLIMPAKFGIPNNSRAVYDEKFQEMLILKNDKSAFNVSLPDIKFMEQFDKSGTFSIVELYNDAPIAKYTVKLLKVKDMDAL